ncbi:serine/threonine-protein kinase [Nocardioides albidus]|uniref:serine/threonine-protein kinase n=1 Tax=Nocardioides albidus TaxID=1517589 RepID=UPI00130533AB|nr:serine/threonine-protein kinase [Nocardioides albidus]
MVPGVVLASRYELRRPVGRGGMAEVWAAHDLTLRRDVAVKVVAVGQLADPTSLERFRQEARTAAQLTHPHLVAVYDSGVDEAAATAYLVMELLPGPSVREVVEERGPLPVAEALDLARQAAAALDAVHRAGVVHRDVKPGNLVLDGAGRLRLVDFGIARLAEMTSTGLTGTGQVVGSAAYLAPEQARGEPATAASDHYALGCVLMTMLTGEPPFTAEHPAGLLHQHVSVEAPRVSARRDVPADVDALVADLLAKDPVRRAAGFAALLGPADATQVLTTTSAAAPRATGLPYRRVVLVAGAALLGLLGGAVLIGLLGQDDEPSDTSRDTAPSVEATTTPPSTAPATPTTSAPSPPTTPSAPAASPVDRLRDTIAQEAASGGISEKAAADLDHQVDELEKWLDKDKSGNLDKKVDELRKSLDKLLAKGEVSDTSADRISAALDAF